MPEDLVGSLVAHFRVLSELGRGGMGVVYEARDEKLGRIVALKVLPAMLARDRNRAARFLREARAAAQITHPAIATVFEIGESEGRLFIAMERIEGRTLRDAIAAGALEPEQALAVARDIAGALAKAHAAGIVHRDLKPENVMLSDDGGVKILDFGIAKALDEEGDPSAGTAWTTRDGMILGTPGYMAPEQAAGKKCDQRADVFAFGVLLFEMLTGRVPFGGDTPIERLASVLKDVPTPLPESESLPEEVRDLVTRCMQKTPEERPANGAELREILERRAPSGRVIVRAAVSEVDPLGSTLATADTGPSVPAAPSLTPEGSTPGASSPGATSGLAPTEPDVLLAAPAAGAETARERKKKGWGRWVGLAVALVFVGPVIAKKIRGTRNPPAQYDSEAQREKVDRRSESRDDPSRREARKSARSGRDRAELPPVWPCEGEVDAGFDFACSEGYVAWCDPSQKRLGCCARGLVPVSYEGECGCPPGGAEAGTEAAKSCPVGDAGPRLAPEVIQAEVRANMPRMRACIDRGAGKDAKLEGRVAVALRIANDGRVYSARIKESSLPSGPGQSCLLEVWKSLRFPPPVGAEGVTVVYPFIFSP